MIRTERRSRDTLSYVERQGEGQGTVCDPEEVSRDEMVTGSSLVVIL